MADKGDIVERLDALIAKCGPWLRCTLADRADIQDAKDEIERLRAAAKTEA